MGVPLSDEIKALLRGANFGFLATMMADGSPQVAAVWVDLEGDRVLVSTGEARNARRDARVGLSVVSLANPYLEAQIRGRVVERRPDPDFAVMDRMARKYTGQAFPWRRDPANRVVLVIEPERARYVALALTHDPAGT